MRKSDPMGLSISTGEDAQQVLGKVGNIPRPGVADECRITQEDICKHCRNTNYVHVTIMYA
jgi:hypothetical protein